VTIAGHDVLFEPDKVRSRSALADESVTMDEYLSDLQILTMTDLLYSFSRRDATRWGRELIERFDLADAAEQPVIGFEGWHGPRST
jgi:ABC-2 type transport system ATP-binding protein